MSRARAARVWLVALSGAWLAPTASAETLAERIVTLSPHLAELVHSAGAGERLVGVSAYSNFPPDVASLPQVGDAFAVDLERLAVLNPDLLLAWESGTPARTVDRLRDSGYRVEVLRTRSLDDIAQSLERIGRLTGQAGLATAAAERFLRSLRELAVDTTNAAPVTVFYQVAARPLYTVNGQHYVSEIVELCGGANVFADLNDLAPAVSAEAVLERDPQVFIAGGRAGEAATFADWRRFRHLSVNRHDNYFLVDPDLLGRPTTRLDRAARAVCSAIDTARARIAAGAGEP